MKASKQLDSMQCGMASLQMICGHYGRNHSIENISSLCPPIKNGGSLLALSNAAITVGFRILCATAEVSELSNLSRPCILHWNQNHFVVLYKVKKGKKFYIADPGKGLVKYSLDEFKSHSSTQNWWAISCSAWMTMAVWITSLPNRLRTLWMPTTSEWSWTAIFQIGGVNPSMLQWFVPQFTDLTLILVIQFNFMITLLLYIKLTNFSLFNFQLQKGAHNSWIQNQKRANYEYWNYK